MKKIMFILLILNLSIIKVKCQKTYFSDASILCNFNIDKSKEKVVIKQLGKANKSVTYNRWFTTRPELYKRYSYDSLGLEFLFYKPNKMRSRTLSSITLYPNFNEFLFDTIIFSVIDTAVLLNKLGVPNSISKHPLASKGNLYWDYNLGDAISFCFNTQGILNHITIMSANSSSPNIDTMLFSSLTSKSYSEEINCTSILDSLANIENNIITDLVYHITYSGDKSLLELTTSYNKQEHNIREFYYNKWMAYFENDTPIFVINTYKSFKNDKLENVYINYFDLNKVNIQNPNFDEYWVKKTIEFKNIITNCNIEKK